MDWWVSFHLARRQMTDVWIMPYVVEVDLTEAEHPSLSTPSLGTLHLTPPSWTRILKEATTRVPEGAAGPGDAGEGKWRWHLQNQGWFCSFRPTFVQQCLWIALFPPSSFELELSNNSPNDLCPLHWQPFPWVRTPSWILQMYQK